MTVFTNIKFYAKEENDQEATFVVEPLPDGYGMTVGNALRRVLLSSIAGAAITKVKIDGVLHEFSTIEGMKEDIVEFVLNLKKVRIALAGEEPVVLKIEVKGQKDVKASDIAKNARTKIINKDLHLASLAKGASLKVELTVEAGVGYQVAESNQSKEIGVLPVDAIFTPVTRVDYTVLDTRVGQQTNFDQLTLHLVTDGTIKPREAIGEAARVLTEAFSMIDGKDKELPVVETLASDAALQAEREVLIDELGMETRIVNSLHRTGIETLSDLLAKPDDDLANIKNLGEKSLKEIKKAIEAYQAEHQPA